MSFLLVLSAVLLAAGVYLARMMLLAGSWRWWRVIPPDDLQTDATARYRRVRGKN